MEAETIEIRMGQTQDRVLLKQLWGLCFEDSKGFIDRFFSRIDLENECLTAIYKAQPEKEIPVGMLFLLPAALSIQDAAPADSELTATRENNIQGTMEAGARSENRLSLHDIFDSELTATRENNIQGTMEAGARFENRLSLLYVYGVATHPRFRGMGIMRQMEQEAVRFAKKTDRNALVLVPQTPGLFCMYERLGYQTLFTLSHTVLLPAGGGKGTLTPCSLDEFLVRRAAYLNNYSAFLELADPWQNFRYWEATFSGNVWLYQDEEIRGYLVEESEKKSCRIRETDLSLPAVGQAAALIREQKDITRVTVCGTAGRQIPYGMIKVLNPAVSQEIGKPYMNLMLD